MFSSLLFFHVINIECNQNTKGAIMHQYTHLQIAAQICKVCNYGIAQNSLRSNRELKAQVAPW